MLGVRWRSAESFFSLDGLASAASDWQFVRCSSSWLRRLDPAQARWTLAFLVPADSGWTPLRDRPGGLLLLIHRAQRSGLRCGAERFCLLALSLLVGLLSALCATRAGGQAGTISRSPQELTLPLGCAAGQPATQRLENPGTAALGGPCNSARLPRLGPWVNRRSAELGLQTRHPAVHLMPQRNLLLSEHPPESLVWALTWAISPCACWGLPWIGLFTLLLALRFSALGRKNSRNCCAAGHPWP